LVEAIAKANGFTPNAKENSIGLWREGEKKRYDYNELLKIKDEDQKVYIQAGDKIDIPDRFF
jgi:protein involved in polysaccharide export with SLBB domain